MQYLDISYRDDFVIACGDIHGEFETLVFNIIQKKIENAIVIVAGDCGFGFNKLAYYDELYKRKLHRKLKKQNVLLLMVRGNHDDPLFFDKELIDYPYMKTLPDYTIVHTRKHNILCVGGAISIDRSFRLSQMDYNRILGKQRLPLYWKDEMFRYDEEQLQILNDEGIKIDTVITHSAPDFCPPFTKGDVEHFCANDDDLTSDLDKERKDFTRLYEWLVGNEHPLTNWFYGHFHTSAEIYDETMKIRFCLLNINELSRLK